MSVLVFIAAELQSILEPFLLRRVKAEVAVDLPKKTELVVYHGMSALQKKYYKAILMKDLGKTCCGIAAKTLDTNTRNIERKHRH